MFIMFIGSLKIAIINSQLVVVNELQFKMYDLVTGRKTDEMIDRQMLHRFSFSP